MLLIWQMAPAVAAYCLCNHRRIEFCATRAVRLPWYRLVNTQEDRDIPDLSTNPRRRSGYNALHHNCPVAQKKREVMAFTCTIVQPPIPSLCAPFENGCRWYRLALFHIVWQPVEWRLEVQYLLFSGTGPVPASGQPRKRFANINYQSSAQLNETTHSTERLKSADELGV